MLPPADDNSKLAQQIRSKLRRFTWIAPLIDAQNNLASTPSQPGLLPTKLSNNTELIPQAPLGTVASRKVKSEPSHPNVNQQGDVSIHMGESHHRQKIDADDDKYRRRPLANVFSLCGIK